MAAKVRWAPLGIVVLLLLFGAVQVVPYGRDHSNPMVRAEPAWDSVRTRELAVRACFDCHSNETKWPWYSNIAPLSWTIQNHVDIGRAKLNFSEWDRPQEEAGESAESVTKGEMPTTDYKLLHPEARLSATEKTELVRGLEATFGRSGEGEGEEEGD
jgi:hypothetical protein